MKSIKYLGTVLLLVVISAFKVTTTNYTIDSAKSTIKWTGYAAAGVYAPTGSIKAKAGSVTFTDGQISAAKLVIDITSIEHSNKQLEGHLKSEDFFDATKYPEATFVLTSVKDGLATGTLSIKNITRPISFKIESSKQNNDLVIKALLKVDRTKYDIKYSSASFFQDLGSHAIKDDFDLDITLYAAAAK
jgi:polyisoprenoid-binding protein YceI